MARISGAPVLVVGAHRSGTSAVTRALTDLGLFSGARLDENQESAFFQRINRRLTAESGGHWTTPNIVWDQVNRIDDLGAFVAPLRAYVDGPGAVEYWGRGTGGAQRRWGWKDPRTTYLLPVWTTLWPDAEVVWVRRNPLECAASIVARSERIRAGIEANAGRRGVAAEARRQRVLWQGYPLLADGWRALDETQALDIALSYLEIAEASVRSSDHRYTIIDYDRLVADPSTVLGGCASFLGLEGDEAAIDAASAMISAPPERNRVQCDAAAAGRLARLGWSSDAD